MSGALDSKPELKALQEKYEKKPSVQKLVPYIKGKIGLIFWDSSILKIKEMIEKEVVM